MGTPMACPRCAQPLAETRPDDSLADVRAQSCAGCGGSWVEEADLKRLEAVHDVRWLEVRHLPPPEAQDELLTCPRCHPPRHLLKLRSERDARVVMDACTTCRGVWLDGGELAAIQQESLWRSVLELLRFLRA